MADESSNKGGLILLLAVLAFIAVVNGVVYLGSGKLLTSSGLGVSCATGLAGFLAAGIVGGALGKIAAATRKPGVRWLAPVVVFAGAVAVSWFLVVPTMRRSGSSFGYEGTYQVTYSGGRTEVVDASVLNFQEWSKWVGGYLGFASGLFLAAIWQVRNRLRKDPAPHPESK